MQRGTGAPLAWCCRGRHALATTSSSECVRVPAAPRPRSCPNRLAATPRMHRNAVGAASRAAHAPHAARRKTSERAHGAGAAVNTVREDRTATASADRLHGVVAVRRAFARVRQPTAWRGCLAPLNRRPHIQGRAVTQPRTRPRRCAPSTSRGGLRHGPRAPVRARFRRHPAR